MTASGNMMRPRVLVSTPRLDAPGGVASFFAVLRGYLGKQAEYLPYQVTMPLQSRRGSLSRLARDVLAFRRSLVEGGYDLVHVNPSLRPMCLLRNAIFVLLAKSHGKKVLVFFHGWDARNARLIRRYFPVPFRFCFFSADACVVLADEFRRQLRDLGAAGPIFVETTLVDDADFLDCAPLPRHDAREPFNVLFLSRIEKTKGIYECLDAFAIVRKKYEAIKLTVVGDGGELAAARRYATRHEIPDVTFTGFLRGERKSEALAGSHCYLFPTSYGEGMPLSVLEAMANGLPVVTRPVGGLRDFFEDGKMGFLADGLEPAVFAEHLERLLLEPELCRRIGQYNKQYAKQRFAASRVAARLENIYRETFYGKMTASGD